jgi:hypothetical protein
VDEGAFETGLRALLDGLALQYEQTVHSGTVRPAPNRG